MPVPNQISCDDTNPPCSNSGRGGWDEDSGLVGNRLLSSSISSRVEVVGESAEVVSDDTNSANISIPTKCCRCNPGRERFDRMLVRCNSIFLYLCGCCCNDDGDDDDDDDDISRAAYAHAFRTICPPPSPYDASILITICSLLSSSIILLVLDILIVVLEL